MSNVRTIDHFGASIVFVTLNARDSAGMLQQIAGMREAVAKAAPGSALVLTDASGAHLDDEVRKALAEAMAANKPFVRASAVVGLSPKRESIKQMLAELAERQIPAFDDVESAMDWLAQEGRKAGGA